MPEQDRTAGPSRDIAALTGALSLEEKAAMTVGIDTWRTAACARLGIPSVRVTDGPNGAGETPATTRASRLLSAYRPPPRSARRGTQSSSGRQARSSPAKPWKKVPGFCSPRR